MAEADGTLVKLIEADDAMQAERLADHLEAAGITVSARTTSDGVMGSLGMSFVLEVTKAQEAEALKALASFQSEERAGVPPAPDAPDAKEAPPETLSPDARAAYQRASTVILGLSVVLIALNVLARRGPLPAQVFGSAIFDLLIWRRFSDAQLSLSTAKKVRFFALSRLVFGAVVVAVLVFDGRPLEAFQLVLLAYAAFLYSRAPVAPPAEASSK
jgi:hypothetical protein